MGAVVLAITGAEALYADMGHFGASRSGVPGSLVFPALTLNYLGQAALILHRPARPLEPFLPAVPATGLQLPLVSWRRSLPSSPRRR